MCSAAAFLFAGCAANQPYHLGEAPTETAVTPPITSVAKKDIYRLGFIEFDEEGDFWDRDQLHKTVDAIRYTGRPVLLVTYIHGWQNNSNPTDAADVEQFRGLLARLTVDPTVQSSALQVFGVYLGWRGRVVHQVNPVIDAVTLGRQTGQLLFAQKCRHSYLLQHTDHGSYLHSHPNGAPRHAGYLALCRDRAFLRRARAREGARAGTRWNIVIRRAFRSGQEEVDG